MMRRQTEPGPLRCRRLIATVLLSALLLAAVAGTAGPASADPAYPSPKTSATVTQLALTGGAGYLTLQVQFDRDAPVGFSADIPSGGGTWATPPDRFVPELGVHCRGISGTALRYLCGVDQLDHVVQPPVLPIGSYQVTVPVRRSGPVAALTGTTNVYRVDGYGWDTIADHTDTFPVVDPSTHFRSTAEVRNLVTSGYPIRRADMAETVTVIPGESVQSIDTALPVVAGVVWKLAKTIVGIVPMTCSLLARSSTKVIIRCRYPSGATVYPIPASRFTLVFKLTVTGPISYYDLGVGTVSLAVGGSAALSQDTFAWTLNMN